MSAKILIIEDEKNIVDILKFNLKKEGYTTIEAFDGETGLEMALSQNPDLVLLDIMLPRLDGLAVCRKIRERSAVPIVMLTAREEEVDKVLGLELGADDYITKPFSTRELLARIKANLRRTQMDAEQQNSNSTNTIMKLGDLVIDPDRYEVKRGQQLIELTLREFELVKFLAVHPDQIFSRENLLEKVWGYEYYGDVRTVDVTVRRIREKLEPEPSNARYIMTKRGVGYYFNKAVTEG